MRPACHEPNMRPPFRVLLGVLLSALLAVLSLTTGCQTVPSVEQSTTPFKDKSDFREWFSHYYANPAPERLTEALRYMQAHHYLEQAPEVAAIFLAKVFAKNEASLATWTHGWQPLGPLAWDVILPALWLSGTEQGQALAKANIGRADSAQQARLKSLFQIAPQNLEPLAVDVVDPRQINLLWGAYDATGDIRYVQKVIASVATYGDDDQREAAIGEMAILTLAANMTVHTAVAAAVHDADQNSPNPRVRLIIQAMLEAVNEVQTQTLPAQAPQEDDGGT